MYKPKEVGGRIGSPVRGFTYILLSLKSLLGLVDTPIVAPSSPIGAKETETFETRDSMDAVRDLAVKYSVDGVSSLLLTILVAFDVKVL